VRGTQRVFSNLGNSSMGYALPAAIGAAIANPSRPVLCVIGDGGMQQNIQELVTARHYDLNIKVVVCNNSGYGIIKQFQNAYLGGRHAATSRADLYGATGVDFAAVAAAYGVRGTRVAALADMTINFSGPRRGLEVFDVIIHEAHGIHPKLEFGNSLENMSPFVDSRSTMIVLPAERIQVSGWVKL
jgi:acetolactate synthase-1/2/3 large subunit